MKGVVVMKHLPFAVQVCAEEIELASCLVLSAYDPDGKLMRERAGIC